MLIFCIVYIIPWLSILCLLQVYSQVIGTLSPTLLESIPGSKGDYLKAHLAAIGVLICKKPGKEEICLVGSLDKVLKSADILATKLQKDSRNEEFCYMCKRAACTPEVVVKAVNPQNSEKAQVSVNMPRMDKEKVYAFECLNKNISLRVENLERLLKEKPSKSKKLNEAEDKNRLVKQTIAEEKEDLETEVNYKLPKSKYGRAIKVPRRLKEAHIENVDEEANNIDTDRDDGGSDEDYTQNRKVKYKEIKVEKEENEKHVRARFLGPSDDKKGLKKYYEDRMPYKFFCDLCSFKTKRQAHILKHKNHHKRPDIKVLECDMCEFKTIRAGHLCKHKLSHATDVIKCPKPECTYETNDQRKLDIHIKRKHDEIGKASMAPLKCQHCSFSSLSKTQLSLHMFETHTEHAGKQTDDGMFHCNECNFKSKKKVNLIRHQDNVHKDRRPHLCDTCGRSFKRFVIIMMLFSCFFQGISGW